MTENEAIDKLNNLHYKILHSSFRSMVYESEIEALCIAKDCLKEIQQYREIGTVEEFKTLKEKNMAKKPIDVSRLADGFGVVGRCPCCNGIMDDSYVHCEDCGQKLDWQ